MISEPCGGRRRRTTRAGRAIVGERSQQETTKVLVWRCRRRLPLLLPPRISHSLNGCLRSFACRRAATIRWRTSFVAGILSEPPADTTHHRGWCCSVRPVPEGACSRRPFVVYLSDSGPEVTRGDASSGASARPHLVETAAWYCYDATLRSAVVVSVPPPPSTRRCVRNYSTGRRPPLTRGRPRQRRCCSETSSVRALVDHRGGRQESGEAKACNKLSDCRLPSITEEVAPHEHHRGERRHRLHTA